MRTKHADNIRQLTHAASNTDYTLNIEVEDLADTTRFQPIYLGGGQVLYIPTPSPSHIYAAGGQVFSQPTPPPSQQCQIHQWLPEDYEGYDQAKTAPTSFETGISRSTWMGMGRNSVVFVC